MNERQLLRQVRDELRFLRLAIVTIARRQKVNISALETTMTTYKEQLAQAVGLMEQQTSVNAGAATAINAFAAQLAELGDDLRDAAEVPNEYADRVDSLRTAWEASMGDVAAALAANTGAATEEPTEPSGTPETGDTTGEPTTEEPEGGEPTAGTLPA